MMTKTELLELIRNGSSQRVEFTCDDADATLLAREVAALLNREGGRIVVGVRNDGTVRSARSWWQPWRSVAWERTGTDGSPRCEPSGPKRSAPNFLRGPVGSIVAGESPGIVMRGPMRRARRVWRADA
ncbi:MAG: hypothetical protein FJ297_18175 [Planctomycetes bacterium]|nr:hypothetical protein [Planctomycetota bacterium]